MTHLGGHMNKTHIDHGAFDFITERHSVVTVLDVGCGPADMVGYAKGKGFDAIGIDGDPALFPNKNIVYHDFYTGPFIHLRPLDMIWSVEFLEHIDEKYLPNVLQTFQLAKMVICTHALPHETGGHNHVNCRSEEYWIEQFMHSGFYYCPEETALMREKSTMTRNFMRSTGKIFFRT